MDTVVRQCQQSRQGQVLGRAAHQGHDLFFRRVRSVPFLASQLSFAKSCLNKCFKGVLGALQPHCPALFHFRQLQLLSLQGRHQACLGGSL